MNHPVNGCNASNAWGGRRARLRVVVLLVVLSWLGWLIGAENVDLYEAIGTVALIAVAAGLLADRIVDGSNRFLDAVAVLLSPGRATGPTGA